MNLVREKPEHGLEESVFSTTQPTQIVVVAPYPLRYGK